MIGKIPRRALGLLVLRRRPLSGSPGDGSGGQGPAGARRRKILLVGTAAALLALVALAIVVVPASASGGRHAPAATNAAAPTTDATNAAPTTAAPTTTGHRAPGSTAPDGPGRLCPCPNLTAGSDPSVLPGPVLVADHMNNRLLIIDPNGTIAWEFPRPGDLPAGQGFLVPDDSFFTPDGKNIVVTEEDDFVIRVVDIAHHRIVWTYGTPGSPGAGPDHLWNPDDAMMTPGGDIIAADIKNCRILVLRPGTPAPLHVYGETTSACLHSPPQRFGSPNGAFPMSDGDYLITEINGDWVDEMTPAGQVRFSAHPPGVAYPSDTNEVRPGLYLTVDYSDPGQIVEFDRTGHLIWRYAPGGADQLDKPSLALPLPNGDVLCNDDHNDRVIVVDPRTNRIVWQYGHTGRAGTAPGYLNVPDGVDLAPPRSVTITHSATMGRLPGPTATPAG